jgi:hypothetical protein
MSMVRNIYSVSNSKRGKGETKQQIKSGTSNKADSLDEIGSDDGSVLVCDTVWIRRQIPTYRKNIMSPSSGMIHITCFTNGMHVVY